MKVGGFYGSMHPQSNSFISINLSLLPPSLTHLSFNKNFNQQVFNLPPSLTHLTFGHKFNQSIATFPPSLTHLQFGNDFSQNINNLPDSLLHLSFLAVQDGRYKCTNITRFPPKLTYLNIQTNIEHLISLPDSLISLYARECIKCTHFPPHLKHLEIGVTGEFDLPPWPSSLIYLHMTKKYGFPYIIKELPPKLEDFLIKGNITVPVPLPSTLTQLSILASPQKFNQLGLNKLPLLTHFTLFQHITDLSPAYFPSSLTHLDLSSTRINYSIDDLFAALPLTVFKCSSLLQGPHTFPKSLKVLKFRSITSPPIVLPPFLEELTIDVGALDQLPSTLKKLTLNPEFFHPLPALPESLEELSINFAYNHPLPALPPKLLSFHLLTNNFMDCLPPLPPHLREFTLGAEEVEPPHEWVVPTIADIALPTLPDTLTHLTLLFQLEEHTLKSLPPRLQYLEVYSSFPLPAFPATLETVIKGGIYRHNE